MNFILWNIRGIGNDVSVGRLKFLIQTHKIDCLVVLEPKIHTSKMEHICKKIGMRFCIANSDDLAHIWIFWRDPLEFATINFDDQQMTISQSGTGQPAFQLTFVYAKCSIQERQVLWRSLLAMHSTLTGPWLVAGDFNCIMATDEKLGGNPPSLAAMSDFIDCSSDCGLIDAGFLGSKYTWHNNRSGSNGIWARLDRVLVNSEWQNSFPISVEHLSREASDHAPLLVKLFQRAKFKSRFCFQKMWTLHEKFMVDISICWSTSPLASSPLSTLYLKLKYLRNMLGTWNRQTFGHVHANLKLAEDEVLKAEHYYDLLPSEENLASLEMTKSILAGRLLQEEYFWK